MSVMEVQALDMATLLMKAYDVGDLINASKEVEEYLYWKQEIDASDEVKAIVRKLNSKKELYEECQRFGHYHPNYHAALDEVKKVEQELDQVHEVKQFKLAEERLDDLLYEVSTTLAYAVSDSIKVPSNKLITEGGCASGGPCSGGCG